MPAGYGQTAAIDTADWSFIVPLKCPLNLAGSRLTGAMTAAFGGPPAAEIDSADGSISWVADDEGLTRALIVKVKKAARDGWRATNPAGQAANVTVVFDVHRYVDGSDADEWLGRTSVLVLPASDSELVTQGYGLGQILINKQPEGGILLPALQTGPQGPPGASVALPTFDPVADEGKTFGLRVVDGALVYVAIDETVTPPVPDAPSGALVLALDLSQALKI